MRQLLSVYFESDPKIYMAILLIIIFIMMSE